MGNSTPLATSMQNNRNSINKSTTTAKSRTKNNFEIK